MAERGAPGTDAAGASSRRVRTVVDDLLDALLPARCPGCGRRGAPVCDACRATLRPAPPSAPPPPVAWWTACFAYEGVARELVARAKYRNERRFLVLVAREVAAAASAAPAPFDLVTFAPASAARIRAHGVDHGELLARAVARAAGVRAAGLLVRAPGVAQTGLGASDRRRRPVAAGGRPGRGRDRPRRRRRRHHRRNARGRGPGAARCRRVRRLRGDGRPHPEARGRSGGGCIYSGYSGRPPAGPPNEVGSTWTSSSSASMWKSMRPCGR